MTQKSGFRLLVLAHGSAEPIAMTPLWTSVYQFDRNLLTKNADDSKGPCDISIHPCRQAKYKKVEAFWKAHVRYADAHDVIMGVEQSQKYTDFIYVNVIQRVVSSLSSSSIDL